MIVIAHQRKIREREAELDPRPQDRALNYTVGPIEAAEANAFIRRYEWLGTIGRPQARYGAKNAAGELAAVATFGLPTSGGDVCGKENRHLAICLERGASAHWAHWNTASWFITRAVAMASRDFGWKIFYAYTDREAGETGVIYRACNWLHLGQGDRRIGGRPRVRDSFRHRDWPKGKLISDRTFFSRYRLSMRDVESGNWQRIRKPAKHKYVWIEGNKIERKALRNALVIQ